jgi:hypothetical protein
MIEDPRCASNSASTWSAGSNRLALESGKLAGILIAFHIEASAGELTGWRASSNALAVCKVTTGDCEMVYRSCMTVAEAAFVEGLGR